MHHPYRIPACVPHRPGLRAAQVRGLIDEFRRWVASDGLPQPPPEHRLLVDEPFGMRLDLSSYDTPWQSVFVGYRASTESALWLTWTDAEGTTESAYVPPVVAWAVRSVLTELVCRLHGDQVEVAHALAGSRPILRRGTWIHPPLWWTEWKSRELNNEDEPLTVGDVYRWLLYPRVLHTLNVARESGERMTRMVDVAGGDGELARLVLDRWPDVEITVVDLNPTSIAMATSRLGEDGTAIYGSVTEAPTWARLGGDHDMALMVGAIQGNVMTAHEAHRTATHAHAALRPGGMAIATGWSPCLVDAAGFEAIGFEVLNCIAPPTPVDPIARQHYVLRRR